MGNKKYEIIFPKGSVSRECIYKDGSNNEIKVGKMRLTISPQNDKVIH